MDKHMITEDELLKRGYSKSDDGIKFTRKIGNKDVVLILNGMGVLPKFDLDNPKKTRHFKQIDTLEDLEEFEKIENEINSKPEA